MLKSQSNPSFHKSDALWYIPFTCCSRDCAQSLMTLLQSGHVKLPLSPGCRRCRTAPPPLRDRLGLECFRGGFSGSGFFRGGFSGSGGALLPGSSAGAAGVSCSRLSGVRLPDRLLEELEETIAWSHTCPDASGRSIRGKHFVYLSIYTPIYFYFYIYILCITYNDV